MLTWPTTWEKVELVTQQYRATGYERVFGNLAHADTGDDPTSLLQRGKMHTTPASRQSQIRKFKARYSGKILYCLHVLAVLKSLYWHVELMRSPIDVATLCCRGMVKQAGNRSDSLSGAEALHGRHSPQVLPHTKNSFHYLGNALVAH